MEETRAENLRQAALDYHEFPKPGKLEIRATKPLANGRDLARAYSPGVAEACLEIKADPATASRYTGRGNMVGVVTNGTAVLGLGNIGALASKPVMEGKAVLFKKFANIDCFDIELNELDVDALVDTSGYYVKGLQIGTDRAESVVGTAVDIVEDGPRQPALRQTSQVVDIKGAVETGHRRS